MRYTPVGMLSLLFVVVFGSKMGDYGFTDWRTYVLILIVAVCLTVFSAWLEYNFK